jgi:predicted ATPase
MLTKLRFKNWRSLRDVTIDNLTPITVFIGANSSGKTNILEALRFKRYSIVKGSYEAIHNWGGYRKIRTVGASDNDLIELEVAVTDEQYENAITDTISITFNKSEVVPFLFERDVTSYGMPLMNEPLGEAPMEDIVDRQFRDRLQLLGENFLPPFALPNAQELVDFHLVDYDARNVAAMLDFMRQFAPDVYDKLQADLRWLLGYFDKLETERTEQETRFSVSEKALQGQEAPTISAGTARLVAMLTAYYALDMRTPELPGLVAIEEPDTAVHPLLLRNFVDLLRAYTEDKEHPRQFILTTHNPSLLDWFEPEEVRIVERNEQGETTVSAVPDHIRETWLNDFRLGHVWLSRSLGGVPE